MQEEEKEEGEEEECRTGMRRLMRGDEQGGGGGGGGGASPSLPTHDHHHHLLGFGRSVGWPILPAPNIARVCVYIHGGVSAGHPFTNGLGRRKEEEEAA